MRLFVSEKGKFLEGCWFILCFVNLFFRSVSPFLWFRSKIFHNRLIYFGPGGIYWGVAFVFLISGTWFLHWKSVDLIPIFAICELIYKTLLKQFVMYCKKNMKWPIFYMNGSFCLWTHYFSDFLIEKNGIMLNLNSHTPVKVPKVYLCLVESSYWSLSRTIQGDESG